MSREYDIMAAGHLCIDIIPRFHDTKATTISEIMRPGKLVNVQDAKISTGGPVSNTGINMKTLGSKVCFCARVGDDELGNMTIDILRKSGNADGIHVAKNNASSYTIVIAPPNIDRIFLHNPSTNNDFGPEDLDPDLIGKCRHFHFGYPPLMRRMFENNGSELKQVFQIAKKAGATTSCDMTLPDPESDSGKVNWREILENSLPYIDIFLPSIEETFFMLYPSEFLKMKKDHNDAELIGYFEPELYSRLAKEILQMGAKMVSLKSGHRGHYFRTDVIESFEFMGAARPNDPKNWAQRELWVPAFTVENFGSATGSGDSAIAGILSSYLKGLTIEKSLKYASCTGWQNVQVLDAVSGIKPWLETTEIIERNMPIIDTNIKADGWHWSEIHGLWIGPNDSILRR